jgi:hypothetical protein
VNNPPRRTPGLAAEIQLVLGYAFLTLRPNGKPPKLRLPNTEPTPVGDWDDQSLRHLIEEGRRQIDRAVNDVDRFRTRGQVVFTTALALLSLMVAGLGRVIDDGSLGHFLIWVTAICIGAVGAAAAFGAAFCRTDMRNVRLDQLHPDGPDLAKSARRNSIEWLAEGYLEASNWNNAAVAGLVTVVRDSVFLITWSALLYGGLVIELVLAAD